MARIYPNNDLSGLDFLQRSSEQSSTVDLKNWHRYSFIVIILETREEDINVLLMGYGAFLYIDFSINLHLQEYLPNIPRHFSLNKLQICSFIEKSLCIAMVRSKETDKYYYYQTKINCKNIRFPTCFQILLLKFLRNKKCGKKVLDTP